VVKTVRSGASSPPRYYAVAIGLRATSLREGTTPRAFHDMVRDLAKQRLKQHVCKRVQTCVWTSGVLCDNNLTGRHTFNTGRKVFHAGNGFCVVYSVFFAYIEPVCSRITQVCCLNGPVPCALRRHKESLSHAGRSTHHMGTHAWSVGTDYPRTCGPAGKP